METAGLLASLPIEQRLALAYAGTRHRGVFLGLFALDARLAAIVRRSAEPLLGQIQLAWWRDQLALAPAARARGEPLIALLEVWSDEAGKLVALVDGWEGLIDEGPVGAAALAALAQARGDAFAAAAGLVGAQGHRAEARRAGQDWGLADLAARLGGHATARDLAGDRDWHRARLARSLRPLAVLHGLARRRRGQAPLLDGPLALGAAIRLGLLGA